VSHPLLAGRTNDSATKPPLIERPIVQGAAWLVVTLFTAAVVVRHWVDPVQRANALNGRLFEESKNSTPFLIVLLLAPLVWWMGGSRRRSVSAVAADASPPRVAIDVVLAVTIGVLGVFASRWYGQPFDGLPPAIHDEFSYLFQARTFLAGRTWLPSFPEHPELFDQMHVLNEGRFASRYFPGTGAWLAPFVAAGNPWEAQWLANGLIAAGVYCVGRLLSGRAVGLIAGLLYVVSPGMLVFSNMLVAHMPTMLGLIVFLWAILACRERPSALLAAIAGTGLCFAMLCRPMTAAGFALPFGIDWLWRLLNRQPTTNVEAAAVRLTLLQTVALGLPLALGFALLLLYNQSITGDAFLSPYQQYTDLYTPRHVYGFNNVARGEAHIGPKTLEHYDRWAQNLTPSLAAENVGTRVVSSTRWTLATVPFLFAAIVVLLDWGRMAAGWKLIVASIVTLHAVHIPYWYAGIMDWHYVFETGPLLLLVFADSTRRLTAIWNSWSARRLIAWWGVLMAVAILVNDVTLEPLWRSRLAIAQSEAMFARGRFGLFREEADELAMRGPIVVFVKADPGDLHMDYVTNPPTLDGPVLVARVTPSFALPDARKLFPDRRAYVFDAAKREWSALEAN
jgi:hypothetical protein